VSFEREEDASQRVQAEQQAERIAQLEATQFSSDEPDTPPWGDLDGEGSDGGWEGQYEAGVDEDGWLQAHGVYDSSDSVYGSEADYGVF
jgi:hypothetical protein